MEEHPPPQPHLSFRRSEIDTSRPFRSVKEAVAVFGERILAGEMHTFRPSSTAMTERGARKSSSSASSFASLPQVKQEEENEPELMVSLKRLEAELEDTRRELKLLKERESDTEIAVASLNAELHKSMSKLAKAEADAAAATAVTKSPFPFGGTGEIVEEEKNKQSTLRLEQSQCLAEILSLGEKEGYFGSSKQDKKAKKKPIVPLIWDIFSRKKSSVDIYSPLYATSPKYLSQYSLSSNK